MKTFAICIAASLFLTSCTLTQPPAPSLEQNNAMMKDDAMMTWSWTKEEMEAMEKDHMMMATWAMMKDDAMMMKKDESMMQDDSAMTKKETGYQVYSPELVANALKSGQKVALFFHATWCPSCKSLNNTLESNLSTIPSDSLIVKVDYDQYGDLKKQYRVVSQHTTVQLNADGTEKSRKLGARSLSEIFE